MPATERRALVTGITGQDGSYLTELLLEKGYHVHGIVRPTSSGYLNWIAPLNGHPKLTLHCGDLTDGASVHRIVQAVKPDEVYNLAAQSHVHDSFTMPEYTMQVNGLGSARLLDAIREAGITSTCRYYQASTSELFGKVVETPQSEATPFQPRSPYAASKLYAHWMCATYRDGYNMFAATGILFNHESPRRGPNFVTQKVVRAAVRMKHGIQKELLLGNVYSLRDWGHTKDYVRGMWMILQADKPDDWVLASGEQHSVKEFCELVFQKVGYELQWEGTGLDEVAYDRADATKTPLIRVDPEFFRPADVETLLGDATKARTKLGWKPSITFQELVTDMVTAEEKRVTDRSDIGKSRMEGGNM